MKTPSCVQLFDCAHQGMVVSRESVMAGKPGWHRDRLSELRHSFSPLLVVLAWPAVLLGWMQAVESGHPETGEAIPLPAESKG